MLNPNATQPQPSKVSTIADIEKRMEEFYTAQKNEVEQSLLQKITREKVAAQKRIDAVRLEFESIRETLERHRATLAELESAREDLTTRVQQHFGRAMDHRKLMENAAVLSIDELQHIEELMSRLEEIHRRAIEETSALRTLLQGHIWSAPDLPDLSDTPVLSLDWNKELLKMKKVQAILTSTNGSDGHDTEEAAAASEPSAPCPEPETPAAPDEAPAESASAAPEAAPPCEPPAEGFPESEEFADADPGWDDIPDAARGEAPSPSQAEAQPAEPLEKLTPEPPAAEEAGAAEGSPAAEARGPWLDDACAAAAQATAPASEPDAAPEEATERVEDIVPDQARSPESLAKILADYRKTEAINNGIDLVFFEVGSTAILDCESFVSAADKICACARDLHGQLTHTESVKDVFLLKQEILNQQEILRKLCFRIVRFCDRESGALPTFLEDILSIPAMKDSIERLTMANWSDPADFQPFVREIEALKAAFEAKTNPPADYIQAVLEQVGLN